MRGPRSGGLRARAALRDHWREYVIEAAALGCFMLAACAFATLLEHPASPLHRAIPIAWHRRVLLGLAMGATAVGIIYSPWGMRSGAHINPSTTLMFYRLGKMAPVDAAFYVVAQFLGAIVGVLVAILALGMRVMDPSVHYVVTEPGAAGVAAALLAEVVIAAILMTVVLATAGSRTLGRYTGLFVGALVMLYITVEAPISGMSMNPARSFAPALVARDWHALWIYFVAPPVGMLIAAQLHLARRGAAGVPCAKMHHWNTQRCIHCEYQAAVAGRVTSIVRDSAGTNSSDASFSPRIR